MKLWSSQRSSASQGLSIRLSRANTAHAPASSSNMCEFAQNLSKFLQSLYHRRLCLLLCGHSTLCCFSYDRNSRQQVGAALPGRPECRREPVFESLQAELLDGGTDRVRLLKSPLLARNLAAGDILKVINPSTAEYELERRSGNLCVRLFRKHVSKP